MWPLHYQWQNIHFSIYFSIMIILKHKLFISVSEDLKTSLHPYFLINIAISHTIAVVFAFNQSCIAQVTSASSVKINLGFHWNTMEKQWNFISHWDPGVISGYHWEAHWDFYNYLVESQCPVGIALELKWNPRAQLNSLEIPLEFWQWSIGIREVTGNPTGINFESY